MKTIFKQIYTAGDYLKKNPTWHVEDSLWKSKMILKMITQNDIMPKTICEVGCGAGEILKQLQLNMPKGYSENGRVFSMLPCKQD